MEEKKYYCPKCKNPVTVMAACGATNYFCDHCKQLVSSKQIVTEKQEVDEKSE